MGLTNSFDIRFAQASARRPACVPVWRRALSSALVAAMLFPPIPALMRAVDAADAAEPLAGMAVSVVRAKRECFSDTVRVSGMLAPKEESQVRADVEGVRVAQILVQNGDAVSAGQVLARLSRPEGMNVPVASLSVQAPVAGTIGRIMTQVGAIVAAAAPPLFLVIVGGEFDLVAQIPSTRMSKIAAGQPARVDVTGVGAITGTVRTVSPEVDVASQTGQARISLGADKRLKMGTFGRATIEVGTSCGISVPLSAVLYGPLGPVVQVVRDYRVETRPVPVGLLAGGNAEVTQGLIDGDLVVKRAGTFLREGDRVRPIIEDEARAAR